MNLSDPRQRVIVLANLFTILALWVSFTRLVVPGFQRAAQVGQNVRAAREQLDALERLLAREQTVRMQQERLEETVARLRRGLPLEEQLPSILEELSEIAEQAHVKIQTMVPRLTFTQQDLAELLERGESSLPVYTTIPVQIDAVAGYHEFGAFLSRIETGSILTEVERLRIAANPRTFHQHDITLVLNVFFASGAPETADHAT